MDRGKERGKEDRDTHLADRRADRHTSSQAGRQQAGKVSAFIHTNYKFNLTLIFFVLQWLLPSYHLWNFLSTASLMGCVAFPAHDYALPMFSTYSLFLLLSVVLFALSLLLLLFCVRVEFFFRVFVHFHYKFIFEKFT